VPEDRTGAQRREDRKDGSQTRAERDRVRGGLGAPAGPGRARRVGAEPRKGREGVWGTRTPTASPQERGESARQNALPAHGVWLLPSETMPTIL
jgi:hypothetical protein